MKKYIEEGVIVETKRIDENSILITFDGEIFIKNEKTEEKLTNFFNELYEFLNKNDYVNIIMDFVKLHSMSSYGIRIVINWMKKLYEDTNNSIKNYQLNINYDKNIEWQETTFASLREIFRDFVEYNEI